MIEKIKNLMSNSNTTDLISYSDEDDYSNFWKDLKPIKYESPIEIFYCREILNIFQDIETLFPITIKNYLEKSKDVEIDCYSIEELKKELNRILYSDHFKTIITNIVTYYTYL